MAKMALTIIVVILAVLLTIVVTVQTGKNNGLTGALGGSGGNDTYLAKNKARSLDAKLARITKWLAIAFMILVLVLSLI